MFWNREKASGNLILRFIYVAVIAAASGLLFFPVYAQPAAAGPVRKMEFGQMEFGSAQQAFAALVNAAASNNTKGLMDIFGPAGKDIISSGDPIEDTNARARFASEAKQGLMFRQLNKDTFLALVGRGGWTFPIPIIKKGKSWIFDTEEGKQEVLDRRIGRNELSAIRASLAYVDAQREYARVAALDGEKQYAQNFMSRRDGRGLYWPGKADSPLGPLFARAAFFSRRNAAGKEAGRQMPYYGYYYKILKKQGMHAPGGAMDYVVDGTMKGGFGLVAYPAKYGVSGVMTFMVNQQGILYEKDLGPGTEKLASEISSYDPGATWRRVDLKQVPLSR